MNEQSSEQGSEQIPAQNPQRPSSLWMQGFTQIITQPNRLDALRGANVYKIAVMAILLYGIVYSLTQYLLWTNPVLREQSYYAANYILLATKQELPPMPASFQFTKALGMSMVPVLFLNLLPLALLFFIVHRVFSKEPLRFLAITGITAYSFVVTSLGMLCTAILQLITGSMGSSFSLGGFVSLSQNYFLNGFLSAIDVFLLWQYWAIATAIVSFLHLRKNYTFLIAGVTLIIYLLFMATRVYLAYQYYQQTIGAAH